MEPDPTSLQLKHELAAANRAVAGNLLSSPSPRHSSLAVPSLTSFREEMTSDFKAIPVIDISPLLDKCDSLGGAEDKDLSEVVKKLDTACREAGFFYVKGHGIPDPLLKKARAISRKFFDLPYEEKAKIMMTSKTGFRGYQKIGENITQGTADMHEAIDCYREIEAGMYGDLGAPLVGSTPWPEYPIDFKTFMEEYVNLLKELARKILRGIALALGGSADTFEGERAGDPFWYMRVIGYPGSTDSLKLQMNNNNIGCGAHTDYGLLTLVNQDDAVVALQVRNKIGEWIDAPPIPGTSVCNIGDMLKVYANGEYESTLHRVINKSPDYRVSVVFFYETNFDTPVEPLDFCMERTDGVAKFHKVIYGEHLVRKVLTNFVSY